MARGGVVEARLPPRLDWNFGVTALLGVALIAPVVVVPGTFFPYVVPRNILFRVAVELAAAICLVQILLRGKRLELRREYVLSALGLFLFTLTLSATVSPARAHSIFGDFERMGGVWAWLHLLTFVLVLRTVSERHFAWLLHVALVVCVGASVHSIIERVWSAGELTLAGNAGLFAGYALMGIAVAAYLAIGSSRYRPLYLAAAVIEIVALIVAENRSSVLGLLVGSVAGAIVLVAGRERRLLPLWLTLGAAALIASTITVVRLSGTGRPTSALPAVFGRIAATDFSGVDASRPMQWTAALAGFRDRPVFGFGPENYHLVWSAHFDPRSREIGEEIFDRTHNHYLEVLATTGIVGAIAFLGVWVAIGYSLYRAFVARRLNVTELAVLTGANIAYATYLTFWFVDISAAVLWLLLASLISRRCNPVPILLQGQRRLPRVVTAAGVGLTLATLAFVLHRHAYVPVRASIALATLDSPRIDERRAAAAIRTISESSAPQTSHFGPVLSNFIDASIAAGNTGPLDRAFETAISAYEDELKRDPLNDRLHTSAARLLIDAAEVYGSPWHLERAIDLLERAVELSPRRSQQRELLAEANSDLLLLDGEEEISP